MLQLQSSCLSVSRWVRASLNSTLILPTMLFLSDTLTCFIYQSVTDGLEAGDLQRTCLAAVARKRCVWCSIELRSLSFGDPHPAAETRRSLRGFEALAVRSSRRGIDHRRLTEEGTRRAIETDENRLNDWVLTGQGELSLVSLQKKGATHRATKATSTEGPLTKRFRQPNPASPLRTPVAQLIKGRLSSESIVRLTRGALGPHRLITRAEGRSCVTGPGVEGTIRNDGLGRTCCHEG